LAREKVKTSIFFSLILLLGIVLAAAIYFYQVFYKSPYFMSGVKIASTTVAGYTTEKAVSRLQQDLEECKKTPIVFYYQGYSFASTLEELSYPINYEEAVNKVWQQEQERDWPSKLTNLDGSREIFYPLKRNTNRRLKPR